MSAKQQGCRPFPTGKHLNLVLGYDEKLPPKLLEDGNNMSGERPNVLMIYVDDLPKQVPDRQCAPFILENIRDKGTAYPNGIIPTPLCGPSRTSFLTGKMTHNHGFWSNGGANGGWPRLEPWEPTALPVAMSAAGYRTGMFGKYINGWNNNWKATGEVPPGWDVFRAMIPDNGGDGDYFDYTVVGTEPDDHYGHLDKAYSTDVFGKMAADFIALTDSSTPFFCYFSPYGTHASYTPAPRHVGTYPRPTLEDMRPSFNSDNSKRAPWLRALPPVDADRILRVCEKQAEVLMSIDEAIDAMFTAIGPDRLSNTLILISGDNGLQRGEQRLNGKNIGYPASLQVPMYARWDGHIPSNEKDFNIVTDYDFTATIVDAAGATMISGIDGVPLGSNTSGRLVEGNADKDSEHNGWIGWVTRNWLYLNYGAGQGEELYKVICDPSAVDNVALNYPDKVLEFRAKTIEAANPLPPTLTL